MLSSKYAFNITVAFVVLVASLLFFTPQQSHGQGIQQPAHVYGSFTTNDCAKIDANGFIVTQGTTCGGAAAAQKHSITFVIDGGGSAITTGALSLFPSIESACTISKTDISSDQSGSITVDIWKKAGAIPSAADKISASAPVTLSSAQLNQGGSISGWSTSVSAGDVFGGTIATASTVQRVTVQIFCQ